MSPALSEKEVWSPDPSKENGTGEINHVSNRVSFQMYLSSIIYV